MFITAIFLVLTLHSGIVLISVSPYKHLGQETAVVPNCQVKAVRSGTQQSRNVRNSYDYTNITVGYPIITVPFIKRGTP